LRAASTAAAIALLFCAVGAAYGAEGTFGPGRFCGQIRTPIRRRDARGVLRSTGRVRTRFGCRVPGEIAQTVSATFAVS
jgi:hypothetical protein